MSISCYIPSKDRPAQCDILLTSLEKNTSGLFEPWIIYTGSNNEFKKGYEILEKKWRGKGYHWFIPEIDSEKHFYNWLDLQQTVYTNKAIVGLFADDCIFYRPDDIGEKKLRSMFENYHDMFTFTYRLGANITIADYVTNRPTVPALFSFPNNHLMWQYNKYDFWDVWGFTTGFDGYLFRVNDLLELSERKSFERICFWEHMICRQFLSKGSTRKYMACPLISNVFVQQINTVHGYPHRTNHTFNMSSEDINKMWLDGYEIDLDSMNFKDVNCTHGEIPFSMKERK